MTAVTIIPVEQPDALYCHYPRQFERQDCHIALDLETGRMSADYNPEIGTAIPMSVFHNRTLWWDIPCLTADAANSLMEELRPLAQRILDGSEIEWDGNNNVGHLDADAQAASDEIAEMCKEDWFSPADQVVEWDSDDWFAGDGQQNGIEALQAMGLTVDSTDDQIAELAKAAREQAESCTDAGYVVIRDAEAWIEWARDELREAQWNRLEEVRDQLADLTEERTALIRQISGWGESSRRIGEAAGLSHTRVQDIARSDA